MSAVLGLDTSNYTTSAAIWDGGDVTQVKRLLPVRAGERGLRQSDAVFHHVRQLPELLEELRRRSAAPLCGVAASDRPQQTEGSYMPCFLVGAGAARELAAAARLPLRFFTHQQGHVAAALYGAGCLDWLDREFLAFHVSGGTTDALLVRPDAEGLPSCETAAHSLDLKAGQLIDRIGVLLGLPFPAGPALEELAKEARGEYAPRPSMQGADCHLSGVENQCRAMLEKGGPPAETALFCLRSVEAALRAMTRALLDRFPGRPFLYAGGVMSNRLIRAALETEFGGRFAPPAFSADNAAGIALLGGRAFGKDTAKEDSRA